MQELVEAHIRRSIRTKEELLRSGLDDIVRAAQLLADVMQAGGKLLCCGNGGSAGDAQHIATELSIRYRSQPERPSLPAMSLAADSSAITACANDFGFEYVFSRQIEGLGQKGDALLGISTSGNSANILEALKAARAKEMKTVLLTGGDGGRILKDHADLVDASVIVLSQETARIQECHIMIGQIFCAAIEKDLFGFD